MFQSIKKMMVIYTAIIFFVMADRFLKALAFGGQDRQLSLIGDILKFSYRANYYIAFSLPLAGRTLLTIIILIIIGLIVLVFNYFKHGQVAKLAPLVLIILGASGNLYDRIKYGSVIDYLDLKYFTVFNLSDVMIVVGVVILIIASYKKEAS